MMEPSHNNMPYCFFLISLNTVTNTTMVLKRLFCSVIVFAAVGCCSMCVEYGCYLQHLFSKRVLRLLLSFVFLVFFFKSESASRDKTIAPNLNQSSVFFM
uniref:(northern house mosquito) hypothetical protein n=1 Tax=Culex pipiens TaxID=7175 RepID=A0A8D8NGM3_CULPI